MLQNATKCDKMQQNATNFDDMISICNVNNNDLGK